MLREISNMNPLFTSKRMNRDQNFDFRRCFNYLENNNLDTFTHSYTQQLVNVSINFRTNFPLLLQRFAKTKKKILKRERGREIFLYVEERTEN